MDIITDAIEFIVATPFIILGWLIVGAIAGDLARRFMGSPDQGCLSDWLLGIVGAIIGGLVASLVGFGKPEGGIGLVIVNLVIATVGAAILIFIKSMVTRRRTAET